MSSGFDDVENLLAEILQDKSSPGKKAVTKAVKGAPQPLPQPVYEAIRDTAIETMDPELLDIASTEGGALSSLESTDREPVAAFAAPVPKKKAKAKGKKVTPGVTKVFKDSDDRKREEEAESLRIPMPKFDTTDFADAIDIRALATLCTLQTSRWHAKAKDRKASADAAMVNNAQAEAFITQKRLLAGADEKLKAIHKIIDAARQKHYDMTLPWTARSVEEGKRTGARLLPNTLFMEYTTEMAKCKQEMTKALKEFVPEYPDLIDKARKNLGKRFDPSEYPHASEIAGHFGLSFDFMPIPMGHDFKGLEKSQLERLAESVNSKMEQMMENAMQETWTRLYKAVHHMYDRLSSPDRAFHYTMTDNIREVTRMLKHLNVLNNKDVEKIRIYLDKFICPHDAEQLRENPKLRTETAAHVKNVLDQMNKLGGKKR
jgi:hypothetical protein